MLAGECVLLVNGEERPLRAWDFFHCPAGTEHVIVGAGDGLAIVLAVGARPDEHVSYPRPELAERYGASAVRDDHRPAGGVHAGRSRAPAARAARLLGRVALG